MSRRLCLVGTPTWKHHLLFAPARPRLVTKMTAIGRQEHPVPVHQTAALTCSKALLATVNNMRRRFVMLDLVAFSQPNKPQTGQLSHTISDLRLVSKP